MFSFFHSAPTSLQMQSVVPVYQNIFYRSEPMFSFYRSTTSSPRLCCWSTSIWSKNLSAENIHFLQQQYLNNREKFPSLPNNSKLWLYSCWQFKSAVCSFALSALSTPVLPRPSLFNPCPESVCACHCLKTQQQNSTKHCLDNNDDLN